MADFNKHKFFIEKSLELAYLAGTLGEVPVGAVIVKNNKIIGQGYNKREINTCVLEHAEIIAIKQASFNLGTWRLLDTQIYSTLEPCIMCAGAIIHARIPEVIFGAYDTKFGAVESLYNLGQDTRLNHCFSHTGGILNIECAKIIKNFFQNIRKVRS